MNRNIHRLRQMWKRFPRKRPVIVALVIAILGVVKLLSANAATYVIALEAESGSFSGGAQQADAAAASGSKSIRFNLASGSLMPGWVRTFTGGDSIAVRWKGIDKSLNPAKYHVFRNGQEVSVIVIPTVDNAGHELPGTLYLDTDVTVGASYSYQIQTESTTGVKSQLTPAVSQTYDQGIGVPMVTTITNGVNEPAILDLATSIVKTWYPKEERLLVRGSYAVPTALTLELSNDEASCNVTAFAVPSEAKIIICPFGQSLNLVGSGGTMQHEMAHILQGSVSLANEQMFREGTADWADFYMLGGDGIVPDGNNRTYVNGYLEARYLFARLTDAYGAELMHQLYVDNHAGIRTTDVLKRLTGKTVGQLWTDIVGKYTSSPGGLKNGAGQCVAQGNLVGTPLQTWITFTPVTTACDESLMTSFVFFSATDSKSEGNLQDTHLSLGSVYCLVETGKTAGSAVQYDYCWSYSDQNNWQLQSNGNLKNRESGLCLQARATSTRELEVNTCGDTPEQHWQLPPD